MKNLNTIEKAVFEVLEENTVARKDDYMLMLLVCSKLGVNTKIPFIEAMIYHKDYNIPNWKTVERCRRKIQQKRPDLLDPEIAKKRHREEAEYKNYSYT